MCMCICLFLCPCVCMYTYMYIWLHRHNHTICVLPPTLFCFVLLSMSFAPGRVVWSCCHLRRHLRACGKHERRRATSQAQTNMRLSVGLVAPRGNVLPVMPCLGICAGGGISRRKSSDSCDLTPAAFVDAATVCKRSEGQLRRCAHHFAREPRASRVLGRMVAPTWVSSSEFDGSNTFHVIAALLRAVAFWQGRPLLGHVARWCRTSLCALHA